MELLIIGVIIVLVGFLFKEAYIYFTIEKLQEPEEGYVGLGKMDFDKSLDSLQIDIQDWNTEQVTNMLGCGYLTTVDKPCFEELDLTSFETSEITAMVTIKNTAYLDYCKKNGLEVHRFNFVETGLITYAKETEHPSLFDGSLD